MKINKLATLILASLGGLCFSEITIEISERYELTEYLVDATAKILTSCYEKQFERGVIIGDPSDLLTKRNLSSSFSWISIGNTTEKPIDVASSPLSRNQLEIFTISASSTSQLRRILTHLKKSRYWNHMGSFTILDRSSKLENDCSQARKFLLIAWTMNLLDVKILCYLRTKKLQLYTHNPYTSEAPDPWRLITTKINDKKNIDDPWSLFSRDYTNDEKICVNLNFDRTKNLGGHAIRGSVHDVKLLWSTNPNKTGTESFGGLDGTLQKMWFRAINAKVNLTLYDNDDYIILPKKNGEISGMAKNLVTGESDIVLNSYYQSAFFNLTTTYPQGEAGFAIITQMSRPLSQLTKIKSVIDSTSRYGLYTVILVTPFALKFFLRQNFQIALLNTLRIICNTGLTQLSNDFSTRIFLFALYSFQITVWALYQGQLASLLTKTVYHRNVETIADIVDLGRTIYVHKSIARLFVETTKIKRIMALDNYDCQEYVLRDFEGACIRDWDILRSNDTLLKLHINHRMIGKTFTVWGIRDDWPIEKRFNDVISRTVESGIYDFVYYGRGNKLSEIRDYNEKIRRATKFVIMTVDNLNFAFVILAFGLALATVVFVFEIIVAP